jgi:hypothetical protein
MAKKPKSTWWREEAIPGTREEERKTETDYYTSISHVLGAGSKGAVESKGKPRSRRRV